MLEGHTVEKLPSKFHALPKIKVEMNPFNGVVLECKNYEVTALNSCYSHLSLYLVIVLSSLP